MGRDRIIINYLGDKIGNGGIESFLANISQGIIDEGFRFLLVANYKHFSIYEERIKRIGGEIVYLFPKRVPYIIKLLRFIFYMRRNSNSVVCLHASNSGLMVYAFLIRLIGNPKIVYHIHSCPSPLQSSFDKFKYRLINRIFGRISKVNVACSRKAGTALYGNKDFRVIHNGIDIERFRFDMGDRIRTREKYGWKKECIIAQVGRLSYAKNHPYVLKLFKNVLERQKNAKLIIIGDGEEYPSIKRIVDEHHINSNVEIVSSVESIEKIYSAVDLLVMPSLWEGFGMVAIEAQVAGLPVIVSENIASELLFSTNCFKIDLINSNEWIDRIVELSNFKLDRKYCSDRSIEKCKEKGFILRKTIVDLIDVYNAATL